MFELVYCNFKTVFLSSSPSFVLQRTAWTSRSWMLEHGREVARRFLSRCPRSWRTWSLRWRTSTRGITAVANSTGITSCPMALWVHFYSFSPSAASHFTFTNLSSHLVILSFLLTPAYNLPLFLPLVHYFVYIFQSCLTTSQAVASDRVVAALLWRWT